MRTSSNVAWRSLLVAGALGCIGAVSPPALAQSSGDKAAAEALFSAGRDLMAQSRFAEACAKLEASQRLDAGLGTLLYLADCYEKANRLASAWATFKEAESIAMGRSDTPRAEVARQRALTIEPRLAKLWIKVADGNAPETQVKRNGMVIPRESWDVALPIDAGDQTIEASAPGRKTWSHTLRVEGEGGNVPVEVPVLEAAPAEAPPPPPTPAAAPTSAVQDEGAASSVGSTQRTIGLVVGGVGVVGLGVGTFFGLKAKSKNTESIDECRPDDHSKCTQKGVALRQDAQSAAKVATVMMIGGGALLAGGIVVYLTAPSGSSASAARGLELTADAGPDSARVALGGAF